jgi:hypothetical protein
MLPLMLAQLGIRVDAIASGGGATGSRGGVAGLG